ncbi:MAG: SPOR domain-containing protein [Thiolinea sp.]
MDNKSTTKRMIGAVVLVLIAALLLAWLLKGKNKSVQEQQEIMAQQTQDAAPILGFPGVNEGDEAANNGQVAQNGEAAQDGSGSYVIGAADQATDNAQQQVQNALSAGGEAASAAGQAAADGANQLANAAGAAAGSAAGAVQQAGQEVANATGFKVRDDAEQRPIVEGGEVKAGTGSMGGSDVAAGDQQKADGAADTQTASTASGTSGAAATQSDSGAATQQTQTAAADNSAGSTDSAAAKPAKQQVANPKLVNEKPVPAPRTQAAADRAKAAAEKKRVAAESARASAAAADDTAGAAQSGGDGYAIQVLAASSRSKAETVKKDIARDGYPAFVVRAKVNGKTVYRVRVGTYPAKGAARAVQTRMKARYSKNQYVQNSFVTRN